MMKIAVPVASGRFSEHFGGAEGFALFTADETSRAITGREMVAAPPHERGAFPVWLRSRGATAVLAAGMGPRASQMLAAYGIEVVLGVNGDDPETLVEAYLEGRLAGGESSCEGGFHDCGEHHHES
jgi:predicted Fe-Mo cluster-binding NifX family protein